MKKGKVKIKSNIVKQPLKTIVPPQQPISTKKSRLLFIPLVIIAFTLLYCLLTYRNNRYKFSCVINPYKEIIATPILDTASENISTSVLCGCLNDSVAHEGILLTGNNVIINRQSTLELTNYVITAPTPHQFDLRPGFTFNASLYCINNEADLNSYDVTTLLSPKKAIYLNTWFQDVPYLSIITPNEINASMFGENQNVSFLPVENERIDIKINDDRYKHIPDNIKISQHSDNTIKDEGVPEIELLGDSIAIIWKGKPKLLGQHGIEVLKDLPDSINYINILVIKSPFSTRITPLAWTTRQEYSWRNQFRSQFNVNDKTIFIGDIPFVQTETGMPFLINRDSIIPAEIPIFLAMDTAKYSLTINKLLTQMQYDSLYKKYSKQEGYYYIFDKKAYSTGDEINMSYPKGIDTIVEKLIKKREGKLSANESLELYRKIRSYDRLAKKDTIFRAKIKYGGAKMYFRYAPISVNNDISMFSYFSAITLVGGKGEIMVNNEAHSTDENSIIELSDLHNCVFQYPALTMGINTPGELRLNGEANVTLNGKPLGKQFYETEPFIVVLAIIGILSFIIAVYQTKPILDAIKYPLKGINRIIKKE